MKVEPISRDVALNVLAALKADGAEGPFSRGDITVALGRLELKESDANISAVLAAQEVGESMPHVEEGAARLFA